MSETPSPNVLRVARARLESPRVPRVMAAGAAAFAADMTVLDVLKSPGAGR